MIAHEQNNVEYRQPYLKDYLLIQENSKERDCRAQHKYDKHAKHGVTSTAAGYVYVKGSKFANLLDIIHKKTYRQESSHDQQNRDQK